MTGKLPPETEKPVPEIESALIETAALPFDVSVIDFVNAVPTETLPNASEVELRLREAVAAFSFSAKLFEEALATAVRFAVWVALTEEIFALKDADDAPAGTVTLAGTETALVLLASVMPWPPESAAMLSATVQVVLPDPVKVLLAHVSELMDGATAELDPVSLIAAVFDVDP